MPTLPFSTAVANVLRFIVIEYIVIKLLDNAVEAFAHFSARRRALHGHKLQFRDGWPSFFQIPYRIRERTRFAFLPWFFVLLTNALLIAIEFGFSSTQGTTFSLVPLQGEIATEVLAASMPPQNVSPVLWMERVQFLHQACVNRRNFLVSAAEGFVRGKSIYSDGRFSDEVVICGQDSRLDRQLNTILFNISHAGQTDTKDQFQFSSANLTVRRASENVLGFRGGGDIDFDVDGTLDLSTAGFNQRDFLFEVSGSCTAFRSSPELGANPVYCYLTDGASNRFILPGQISESSPLQEPSTTSEGQVLRLQDSSGLFRAEIFDYLGEESVPRDGDHLAAIKTFAVVVRAPQSGVLDEAAVPLLLPAVSRTFCIATLFGATSLRNTSVTLKEGEMQAAERAFVEPWALAMLCCNIGVTGLLICVLAVLRRKDEGWNIPVGYNAAARLAMDDKGGPDRKESNVLQCGLRYRDGSLCYGVLGQFEEAVSVKAAEEKESTWE